jgi:ABC-2 type transport system permease protein
MWWSIGIIGFIFITMVFYPTFKDQGAELAKSFQNLPDAAVQLFGGSTDFFSPVGYLNSQIFFLMLPLLLTALAVALGASLIGKEEDDKTIEILLARPLSRTRVLFGKALAGVAILSFVSALGILSIAVSGRLFDVDVATRYILLAGFDCWLLALATGAVAFLLTSTGKARNAAVGAAALLGVGGYLISSLSETVDWLEVPSKLMPFHYYQSEATLNGNHHWANALFPLAIILLCAGLSYLAFRRRDID